MREASQARANGSSGHFGEYLDNGFPTGIFRQSKPKKSPRRVINKILAQCSVSTQIMLQVLLDLWRKWLLTDPRLSSGCLKEAEAMPQETPELQQTFTESAPERVNRADHDVELGVAGPDGTLLALVSLRGLARDCLYYAILYCLMKKRCRMLHGRRYRNMPESKPSGTMQKEQRQYEKSVHFRSWKMIESISIGYGRQP